MICLSNGRGARFVAILRAMARRGRYKNSKETLIFIVIATILMILADQFLFGGTRPYIEEARRAHIEAVETDLEKPKPEPQKSEEEVSYDPFFDQRVRIFEPDRIAAPAPVQKIEEEKPTEFTAPATGERPKIAIIIDDIGMVAKGSARAINLPVPVTLAFLPYAEATPRLAREAKARGHELIIHIPMEAMSADVSLGGMGLTSAMSEAAFNSRMSEIFGSFEGYAGVNNHMGSKLTQDRAAMARLMAALKERGLFFVDSKTISSSVAAEEAARAGLAHATRDIFIDHEDTPDFIARALKDVERTAIRQGYAIAIGHPKDNTLNALHGWMAGAKARGFDFVPVSDVLKMPQESVAVDTRAADLNQIAPASGPRVPLR